MTALMVMPENDTVYSISSSAIPCAFFRC